jgi:hypothetical protein
LQSQVATKIRRRESMVQCKGISRESATHENAG